MVFSAEETLSQRSGEGGDTFLPDPPEFIECPALAKLRGLEPVSEKLLVHVGFVEAHLRRRNSFVMQQSVNGLAGSCDVTRNVDSHTGCIR